MNPRHGFEMRNASATADDRAGAVERSYEQIVRRVSRALEWRDPTTAEHVERVSALCARIAGRLRLGDRTRELLRLASPLHDVGKIAVPEQILLKPGPLTRWERAIVERHPLNGHALLAESGSELLEYAASISLTHHERFDGAGYPRGLRRSAIPLEGRVTAVADVFDALTSDRPYRAALPLEHALELMVAERGRAFDPDVLDALLETVGSRSSAPLAAAQ